MGLFSKESKKGKEVVDYSPLELVTHIIVCIQLADGRIDFEERESWADILITMFPDHNRTHAMDVLREAGQKILEMDSLERQEHLKLCTAHIKEHFPLDYLREKLLPQLIELTEADGIVFTSETDMIEILRISFQE